MSKSYRESLGLVNLEDHHSNPSFDDRSSFILMQYGSSRDRQNLNHSEVIQNSQNRTTRGIVFRVKQRQKLVSFLQEKIGGSGKKIRRSLENNACKINGRLERFGSVWVEKNSIVEYLEPVIETMSWDLLFEDEDLKIVSKPPNWVCNDLSCQKTFGKDAFLVHRLDKDTTGALIIAKSEKVRDELMDLFAQRLVEKRYLAIVDSCMKQDTGVRDTFLAKKRSFEGQTIYGSCSQGDRAVTRWEVLKRGSLETLVRCEPLTGRTHQLRVHLAEMGHPILIDRQYADRFRSSLASSRPLLHAERVRFSYRGAFIEASAPLPTDFKKSLALTKLSSSFNEI